MSTPTFFLYRNRNKSFIHTIMKNINWEANNESTDLANSDTLSPGQLNAMRFVARMKEAADKAGIGFVGGFVSPTGERFLMSNMDADENQIQQVQTQINEESNKARNYNRIRKMLEEFEG